MLTGTGLERLRVFPEGVEVKGRVPRDELAELYRTASALVFPSLYEGFGQPPLEAMASGTPVAVSRAGSLPEVCGDAALYFDPTSVDELDRGDPGRARAPGPARGARAAARRASSPGTRRPAGTTRSTGRSPPPEARRRRRRRACGTSSSKRTSGSQPSRSRVVRRIADEHRRVAGAAQRAIRPGGRTPASRGRRARTPRRRTPRRCALSPVATIVVVRLVRLEHQPHRPHVVRRRSPSPGAR